MMYLKVFLVCFLSSSLFATIQMEAFYREAKDGSGLLLYITLVNDGDETICVPTKNIGPLVAINDSGIQVVFCHVNPLFRDKTFLKFPEDSFSPVLLKSGERTFFYYKIVAARVKQNDKILVEYRVDAQVAKIYSYTQCSLECEASMKSFFYYEQKSKGSIQGGRPSNE